MLSDCCSCRKAGLQDTLSSESDHCLPLNDPRLPLIPIDPSPLVTLLAVLTSVTLFSEVQRWIARKDRVDGEFFRRISSGAGSPRASAGFGCGPAHHNELSLERVVLS
jgi:hypothetical protein